MANYSDSLYQVDPESGDFRASPAAPTQAQETAAREAATRERYAALDRKEAQDA